MKTMLFRSGSVGFAIAMLACTNAPEDSAPGSGIPTLDAAAGDSHASADPIGNDPARMAAADGGAGAEGRADDCDPLADDPPDDEGIDSNCDGVDGVAARDVFVDATNSSDNYRGSPDAPVASLARAITLAQSRKARILVRAGNYALSQIDNTGAWSVYGGYAAGFLGKPKRDLTVFAAPAEGLLIANATEASLHHLTILGANATAVEQRSAHALRTAGQVTLDDVVVQAGNAESGQSGAAGGTGANGAAGSGAGLATDLNCGGHVWPSGKGASFQLPNGEGALPGDICISRLAAKGSAGQQGAPGADASPTPRLVAQLIAWEDSQPGDADAMPGFGGPGGGSAVFYPDHCSSNVCDAFNYCSVWGGGGGTGGCPGAPGLGARSGGGAIAILVLSGKVTVTRSLLATGFGGNGGDGGFGGDGGRGGPGGAPQKGRNGQIPTDLSSYTSAIGGAGGQGGKGGRAGAGAGGWTIAVLTAAGAAADVATTTQFQLGKPGVGGQSASGVGPIGQKQTIYRLM